MTTKKSSNDCKCKNTKGVLKAKAVGRKKKDKASEGCAAQRVKPVTGNKRKTLEAVFIIGMRGQHGVASSKEVGRLVKTATAKSLDTTISAMVNADHLLKRCEEQGKQVLVLTEEGKKELGEETMKILSTNQGVLAKLRGLLSKKPEKRVLDVLSDGKFYDKEEVAEVMNQPCNRSFATYVSALSKLVVASLLPLPPKLMSLEHQFGSYMHQLCLHFCCFCLKANVTSNPFAEVAESC